MLSAPIPSAMAAAQDIHWHEAAIGIDDRAAMKGQQPCLLWFTGLSGAGKSTIATLVEKQLHRMGRHTYLLDGDNLRFGLNRDLGFGAADRAENIRRVGEVARLMVDAGLIVLASFISPFRADRQKLRDMFPKKVFFEIFVDVPLAVAMRRDPKGLYGKARHGELKNFTGIDSPYETPLNPQLRIDAARMTPEAAADAVIDMLRQRSGSLVANECAAWQGR